MNCRKCNCSPAFQVCYFCKNCYLCRTCIDELNNDGYRKCWVCKEEFRYGINATEMHNSDAVCLSDSSHFGVSEKYIPNGMYSIRVSGCVIGGCFRVFQDSGKSFIINELNFPLYNFRNVEILFPKTVPVCFFVQENVEPPVPVLVLTEKEAILSDLGLLQYLYSSNKKLRKKDLSCIQNGLSKTYPDYEIANNKFFRKLVSTSMCV